MDFFSIAVVGMAPAAIIADFFGLRDTDRTLVATTVLLLVGILTLAAWTYRRAGRLRLWGLVPLRALVVLVSMPFIMPLTATVVLFVVCESGGCRWV